jgi:hypothetical protein
MIEELDVTSMEVYLRLQAGVEVIDKMKEGLCIIRTVSR